MFQRGVSGQSGFPAAKFLEAVPLAQPACRRLRIFLCPRLQSPPTAAVVYIKPSLHAEPVVCGAASNQLREDLPRVSLSTQPFSFHVAVGLSATEQVRLLVWSLVLVLKGIPSLKRFSHHPVKKSKSFGVHGIWCSCIKAFERAFSCLCLLPA